MNTVEFTVLGGGSEIGANSYLVSGAGTDIVLDCGIHPKKEGLEALPDLSLLTRAPDVVLVSHGHVDHCGAVPCLLRQYPGLFVYATRPTVPIMDRMLHNSVSVMEMLERNQGVRGYPLYSHEDVGFALRRTDGLDTDYEFALTYQSPVRAEFRSAGHVLGSACILLRFPGHTVFYTGDICLTHQELMSGHVLIEDNIQVDTLICESTRGAQKYEGDRTYEAEMERFAVEATKVVESGGVVLVPAFALGRSQELLNIIARLKRSHMIPRVPVYASGLGRAIYEIYNDHLDYLRPAADLRPLDEFGRVGNVWEPESVDDLLDDPCIIVATSGMMVENTPSAMIAKEMVRSQRHGIFFVGYLDPDTLGYRLLHANTGDKMAFETPGRNVKIRLENRQQFSFSAHASRDDLRRLIEHLNPKNIVFVHGDPDAIDWMSANTNGQARKIAPMFGQTVVLEA
ncbi:MAG TPA: MBL fold metallo-hydrolase RNA specificity domain-containing protein [Candidatus Hydrogenedentes bacterium]|nr:MBL fold metallo-hydrolase RNA specificity domain-containing protein [Candidatus Hydrogenedentota bacterium]